MNPKHNPAGKSTREMADRRRRNGILVGLLVLGILIVLGLFLLNAKAWGIGGTAILIILIAMRFLLDWLEGYDRRSRKREKQAIRGAKAEETVGSLLDTMGSDFFAIHDVSTPFGNIDHVVIGEHTGLFLIETKSHHGKVSVSGDQVLVNGKPPEKDFVKQILNNTYWLREKVTGLTNSRPWVTSVLVFTNAFVPVLPTIKGIQIINKRYLSKTISKDPKADERKAALWRARENIAAELSKGI
jgi:hypothetical protein